MLSARSGRPTVDDGKGARCYSFHLRNYLMLYTSLQRVIHHLSFGRVHPGGEDRGRLLAYVAMIA